MTCIKSNNNSNCNNGDNTIVLSNNKNNHNSHNNNNHHNSHNNNNQHFHFHLHPQHTVSDIRELVNRFKSDDYESVDDDDENESDDGYQPGIDLSVAPLAITDHDRIRRCFNEWFAAEFLTETRAMMDTQCPLCDKSMEIKEPYQVYDVNLECFYCDGCDKKIKTCSDDMVYHCECNDGYDLCEKCVIEVCDLANFPACNKLLLQNKYKTIHTLKQRIIQRTSDDENIYDISINKPKKQYKWIKASSLVKPSKAKGYKYKCLITNKDLDSRDAKREIERVIYKELGLNKRTAKVKCVGLEGTQFNVISYESGDGSPGWLVLDPAVPSGIDWGVDVAAFAMSEDTPMMDTHRHFDSGVAPLGVTERIYKSNRRCFVFPEYIKVIGRTQCPLCDKFMEIQKAFQVYGDGVFDCVYCDGCDNKIETFSFSDDDIYHCECNGGYDLCEKCVIEVCDLENFPACRKILTQNKYKTIHALKQRVIQKTSDDEKIYEISIDPPLNITGQRGRFWIKASSLVTSTKSNKYKYKCLINNAFLAADTAKMQIQHMIYRELRLDPLMQQQWQ